MDASALEAVKRTSLPILFIHGTEDVFVPPEMSRELYYEIVFSFLEKHEVR